MGSIDAMRFFYICQKKVTYENPYSDYHYYNIPEMIKKRYLTPKKKSERFFDFKQEEEAQK